MGLNKYLVEIWVPPVYVWVEGEDENEVWERAEHMIDDGNEQKLILEKVEESLGDCEVSEIHYEVLENDVIEDPFTNDYYDDDAIPVA